MSQVAVQKVSDAKAPVPVFEKIANRLEEVRQRAFELFEKRGRELGHDLEDWFKAEHELLGWPAAELAEKDGSYQMQISLPGFETKDVEVTATPTQLIVHAATKEQTSTQKGNVLWTEFGSNEIYRSLEVPNPIEVDKVTATLANGILRISAPETTKPKEVKSARA